MGDPKSTGSRSTSTPPSHSATVGAFADVVQLMITVGPQIAHMCLIGCVLTLLHGKHAVSSNSHSTSSSHSASCNNTNSSSRGSSTTVITTRLVSYGHTMTGQWLFKTITTHEISTLELYKYNV